MGKIAFVVTDPRHLLTEEDVYDVVPVAELSSLLREGCSLTLAFHGEFASGGYMLGTYDNLRGTWITPDGEKKGDRVLFVVHPAESQSSAKNSLDKTFSGPYLFCSWKKDGSRTFKLGQQGKALAEYATFDEGVSALIPGRFMPRGIYYRKYNWIEMMGLIARKQREQRELFTGLLRCIRHSMYLKYAKEVIQRFDVAVVPYSDNLYASLLIRHFGITRIKYDMLVFNRRKFLLEHYQNSCRETDKDHAKFLTKKYPVDNFQEELVEMLMKHSVSNFLNQRNGCSVAKHCKYDASGWITEQTGKFILSDRDAELERIANKMELLRLSTLRKQNAYFLLERILCRDTFEKLPMTSKKLCLRNEREK